jgi:predicted amidophosphoribosyltransferase
MMCSICHQCTGELNHSWLYCHSCNIQICNNNHKILVYDIDEQGELHINQMKSSLFQKGKNRRVTGIV